MAKKKKKASKGEESISLEDAMQELESIVDALESGQTTLSESLQQFERGTSLLKTCHQQLDSAAQRIELLSSIGEDGITTVPFDGTATTSHNRNQNHDDAPDEDDSTLF